MRDNLTEGLKIFKVFDKVNGDDYFTFDQLVIIRRQKRPKITDEIFTSNEAKHFFN